MFTKVKAVPDPAPAPSRSFVVFLQLEKNGPLTEKIVEADHFELDRKRGVVDFYVGGNRDGYFRYYLVAGVVEVIVEEE